MRNTHDNIAEHLDESSVAVPCETLITGFLDKSLKGIRIETEVENRVHHARHGLCGTRADRNEKRILLVSELRAHELLKLSEVFKHFLSQAFGIGSLMGIKIGTGFSRDRESWRNRKSNACHVSEIGTLASQKILHVSSSFSLA